LVRLLLTFQGLAVVLMPPIPCYKLAAGIYRKTQIEALNKKNLKKRKGWK